jgi:hypothetical protein
MVSAKERAKKAAKTRRLPRSLQQRERLLDSIDLVQRLNDAAAARRGMAHARNIGIESERMATHASGATHAGLSSIAEQMRHNERQMAADFAAAARGTPRRNVSRPTPTGSMTEAPATPDLPPFGPRAVPGTPVGELLTRRRFVVR